MTIRLPAEWEPQALTMMTWPNDALGEWKQQVSPALLHIASALQQPLLLSCCSVQDRDYIAARLPAEAIAQLCIVPTNDIWARDYGPVTVLQQNRSVLLNFSFNGWGGRYAYELDNNINRELYIAGAFGKTDMRDIQLQFEGGGIDCDGCGHLLLRRQWLQAHGRNSDKNITEISELLQQLLNVDLLWLEHGHLQGDDTDDHIDMLARFAGSEVIVYAYDQDNPSLDAMHKQLRAINRQYNNRWELLPLQLPQSRLYPASYVNFIVTNNTVIVPQYGQSSYDREAAARLATCFPDKTQTAVDSTVLATQGGGPHCVTMHITAADNSS